MPMTQLDTENADLDLTALITCLTDTPDASNPTKCMGLILLGDGAKNLDGTGGAFELVITVGGQTVQPSPQEITFGTEVRSAVWTTPFPVPANTEVILRVKSPNGADTDVDATAYLYDVGANGDIVANNLDHLCKVTTAAADMTTEITDNSILSRILANGDTSAFVPSTDGLQPLRDQGDSAWITATSVTVSDKTGFSLAADQSAATIGAITGHTAQSGDTYAALPTNFSDLAIAVTTGYVTSGTNADKTGYTLTNLTDASAGKLDDILDGTGAVATFSQVVVNSAAAGGAVDIDNSNGPAIKANGTTHGIEVDASAGPGLHIGGTTFGVEATASAGPGVSAVASAGTGPGLKVTGFGSGAGVDIDAGATGIGVDIDATAGSGVDLTTAAGSALLLSGTTHGAEITASAGPAVEADGTTFGMEVDASAGPGVHVGGTTFGVEATASAGPGVSAVSTGGNGAGVAAAGNGSGEGVSVAAGATGDGIGITTTSGDGIDVAGGTAGHGVLITGGATGDGLHVLGGGTSGDGVHVEAQTDGDGVQVVAAANGHGLT
ncbi:hypothetical protein HQ590_07880, partial [bacterium]|nr:hypothetical protein [bacterium]